MAGQSIIIYITSGDACGTCLNNLGKPKFIFIEYIDKTIYSVPLPFLSRYSANHVGLSLHVLGQMDPLYTYLYVP